MTAIRINTFAGELPRVEPRLLSNTQAQKTLNCHFRRGVVNPIKESSLVASLPDSLRLSIYNYKWNSVDNWLSFLLDTDVAENFLSDDQYNRIYAMDGVKPTVKYTLSGVEQPWAWWGVPKPTLVPTLAVQDKTSTTWTRNWVYWYEEPDGTRVDEGTLTEGGVGGVVVTTPGSVYTLASGDVPTKVDASAAAFFVMAFDSISQTGTILGRVIPSLSKASVTSDLFIDGSKVSATQTSSGDRVMTLSYDTTETSNYEADRSYVYTYVNILGEEGPPCDPSNFIGVEPDQDVLVSNMDVTQPTGSYIPIQYKRIYRTVTGNAGTAYQFVAEIDLLDATYTDSLTDLDTEDVLPSAIFDVPADELHGLRAMPNEFYVAFKGKTVYFSVQQYVYAWPEQYGYSVDDDIIGIDVSGNTVVVGTVDKTYLITAIDPVNVSIHKIPSRQSCVSKRSMITAGGSVMYASPDGGCAVVGATISVVTEAYFAKEDWEAMNPASMVFTYFEDHIYVMHDTAYEYPDGTETYMFSFQAGNLEKGIIRYPDILNGAIYTPEDDSMYVIDGNEIRRWEGSTTNRKFTWKSKEFNVNRPRHFVCIRDTSDFYPDTFNIYANNILVQTITMNDNVARKIPKLRREKFWAIEVVSDSEVQELLMTTSMGEV